MKPNPFRNLLQWFGGLLFLIAMALFLFLHYGPHIHWVIDGDQTASLSRTPCQVLNVYDGDTLACDLNGDGRIERPEEKIRLLGIDSPEMHYSKKNPTYGTSHPVDQPIAPEASRWLEMKTSGKVIYLEFDLRRSDRYGRTLAFIYSDPTTPISINQEALSGGYAKALFMGRNRLHKEAFLAAEAEARNHHLGLWQ